MHVLDHPFNWTDPVDLDGPVKRLEVGKVGRFYRAREVR
jgi:hypothetical protein